MLSAREDYGFREGSREVGWTSQQRMRAILAVDEEVEDASVPLGDRIGSLGSALHLLLDVAREEAAAAVRLKAVSQVLVSTSPNTPSEEQLDTWFRFEADLALQVLPVQPADGFSAIDKSFSGADRELLDAAA